MCKDDLQTALLTARRSQKILHRAQLALHRWGLGDALLRLRRIKGAVILMYHAIVREEDERWIDPRFSVPLHGFIAQMDYLARHRTVVPLDELVETIRAGRSLPAGTVAITFDDGYRSTLELAAPVLERHGLPATVYLATGYISREQSQWVDALYSTFVHRKRDHLDLSSEGISPPVRLRGAAVITRTYARVAERLLSAPIEERQYLLSVIEEQLRPDEKAPRLTLSWDEVDQLRKSHHRIEIGVHTRDHIDLATRRRDIVQREIDACISDVNRELGLSPRHFAFPYGRCNPQSRELVARTRLRSAAITDPPALVRSGTDRLGLPRIAAPRGMSLFPFWTSGAHPALLKQVLRRT